MSDDVELPGPPTPADADVLALANAGELSASPDRPWLFGFLIAPSGVLANGLIQGGVLAYMLSQQGVGSGKQSHLIALLSLPTSLYFLWSPITDFFMRRRTWLLLGSLTAALLIFFGFAQPSLSSSAAFALLFLGNCCTQLVVSSCGGMMGAMHRERSRRVAGSFYQAGSLGFGALAAWLMVRAVYGGVGHRTLGLMAALLIAVPALAAMFAPRQHELRYDTLRATVRRIGAECRETFWRWQALPYVAAMLFPMASGAAIGLVPGVARSYHVNGAHVAWINGLFGGLLTAAGSGALALVRARVRALVQYMLVALLNCAALAILWLGPLTPETYYVGVSAYLFTIGACYAGFTAVVLEFLGASGKSGSGRYSVINSLGNVPVLYMIWLDGWGGQRWGARGLAGTETVVGAAGALALLVWYLQLPRPPSLESA